MTGSSLSDIPGHLHLEDCTALTLSAETQAQVTTDQEELFSI